MSEAAIHAFHVVLMGMGATATMDLWAVLRNRLFGITMPDYGLVGRWLAYLPRGRFRHDPITATSSVRGEKAMGWLAHYFIGIAFAAVLLVVAGFDWVCRPTPGPALIVGLCTVTAPYFILQPGMGLGIAACRARRPAMTRLHSLVTHAVFGLGLYLTARASAFVTTWL